MPKRKKSYTICEGCLSTDRNLSPITDHYDLYLTLMGDTEMENKLTTSDYPVMCWECNAILRNIAKFKQNVLKAYSYLTGKINKRQKTTSCLSCLNPSTKNGHIFDIKEETGEIKMVIDVKVEETTSNDQFEEPKPNIVEFNIDSPEHFKDDYEIEHEMIDDKNNLEVIQIKQDPDVMSDIDKPVIVKNEDKYEIRTRNKKVSQKYKIIRLCDRDELKISYDKITIDNTERAYWLEQERNYRNYKLMAYKCELCITGYAKEKYYLRHLQIFHSETSGEYTCDICKKQYHLKNLLQSHVKKHNVKYVCKLCKYECYHTWKMNLHFDTAHRRTVECLVCGLRFTGRHIFFKHYNELHAKFVCDYCGTRFNTKKRITTHIRLRHSEHSCKECRKTYTTLHALVRHNNLHHVKSASELCYCVECNMQFENVTLYTRHLKQSVKHSKKTVIPCPECDKVYHRRHVMTNHYMHVHLKKTNHYCDICDRYFLNGYRFRQHKASIHDKIPRAKNKICAYCNRGFSTNRILENHIRTHTGERPFACDHCTSTFAQRQALLSHTRSIHKIFNFK